MNSLYVAEHTVTILNNYFYSYNLAVLYCKYEFENILQNNLIFLLLFHWHPYLFKVHLSGDNVCYQSLGMCLKFFLPLTNEMTRCHNKRRARRKTVRVLIAVRCKRGFNSDMDENPLILGFTTNGEPFVGH